jgi:hypothetical protein
MKSNFAEWAQIARRFVAFAAVAFAIPMMASLRPACAVDLPSDDDQDVLVRTTLMTFNDANMTGNYSVFIAKASKQFQSQIAPEKLASSLESFRTNRLFFESVVTEDYEATEKPTIDAEGGLNLGGVFKTDDMEVKYKLRFIQNDNVWKLLGFNVDAKKQQ